MSFDQLQEKIGKQNIADWHQHEKGRGWVHKSAVVDKTAYIGESAIVFSGHTSSYSQKSENEVRSRV